MKKITLSVQENGYISFSLTSDDCLEDILIEVRADTERKVLYVAVRPDHGRKGMGHVFDCGVTSVNTPLIYAIDDEYINVWAVNKEGVQIKVEDDGIVVDRVEPSGNEEKIESMGYLYWEDIFKTE